MPVLSVSVAVTLSTEGWPAGFPAETMVMPLAACAAVADSPTTLAAVASASAVAEIRLSRTKSPRDLRKRMISEMS